MSRAPLLVPLGLALALTTAGGACLEEERASAFLPVPASDPPTGRPESSRPAPHPPADLPEPGPEPVPPPRPDAGPATLSPSPGPRPDAAPVPPRPPDAALRRDASAPPDGAPPLPAPPPPPVTGPAPFVPRPSPRSVALFDETRVIDLHLTFPAGDFDRLLDTDPLAGDGRWVRCSLTFEGETFPAAACRRKGRAEAWAIEGKPQMIVRFNLTDKKARFRGLRRLNLEAFDGAAAPIRDRLGMWLMREAGLDASRANSARVFVDGQYLGLYQNVEAVDKELLEDHFGPEATGDLWEDGEELETNEERPDPSRLERLHDLWDAEPLAGDHAEFFRRLDEMMDIPQVLRMMAAETAIIADDNFSNGSTNFYYYDHPRRGFLVLPWDYDTILTGSTASAASDPFAFWGPSPPSKLRQLINQNPAWRAQFVDHLVDIRDHVLARMPQRVGLLCDQIREAVAADSHRTSSYQDFEADCERVQTRIRDRVAALRRLLGR